jgi:hypothetical protein
MGDALECYIGGRRIFQDLSGTPSYHSNLSICALRNWLKGALAAHEKEPSYGRDEKLVYAIEQFEQEARNDTRFAVRWQKEFTSLSDYSNEFERYKALEFGFSVEIPRLLDENNLRAADIVTDGLIRRIEGTQSAYATGIHGITRDKLLEYQEEVKARRAKQ